MSYDLKITGATIVDGTGAAAFTGDVAVKDGLVVAVGDCPDGAQETVDAHGATLTPGFTDIHTHYDGQASWDASLAPSSLHGVTTTVMGSCGVGFAPVRPTDRETLVRLMEGVEDIPGTALSEGITWEWESFAEYMDALGRRPHAIDFACQVPHDALRVYVMGARAVAEEAATAEDVAAMQALLRAALEAGAVGFSTGRTDNHRTSAGDATPASEADRAELVGLAGAFEGLGHGVLQAVSDFDMATGPERFHPEFDLLEAMAAAAGGHATSLSLMERDHAPDQWRWILERVEKANERGVPMRVQVASRPIGVLLGLEATFHPFMGSPSYKEIHALPLAERVAAMRDPARKARMLTEKSGKVAGDGSSIPPLADVFLQNIEMVAMRLYRLGETPDYEPKLATCLYAEALRRKVPLLEAIYDALLEDDGKTLLYFPIYNYAPNDLSHVREMLAHPLALPGLSDGGAHVGTICDASMPTFLLQHWGRDRAEGFPLERLVKMQAHDTARYMGFRDRGTIAPGQKADLNLIDMSRLKLRAPRLVRDLPAGGQRLMQEAEGYLGTWVSGVRIAESGALTGATPGRLVRGGR
ncbi:MAG: amidohydrolase family protein [Myxococcota bacterium]